VRIAGFTEDGAGAAFTLLWKGKVWADVHWTTPGLYNARNAAMAATAAALAVSPEKPTAFSVDALERFRGVKRRQELLVNAPGLKVIEDFGHHPTALAETLQSFRARFKGAVLTAVFEPRSNTARTKTLQAGFTRALAMADEVYLGAVNRAEKLGANERFDGDAVVQQLEAQGVDAHAPESNAALLDALTRSTLPVKAGAKERVVIFFTNGSFDGIIAKYAQAAKAAL
jgi:UDP-N-acetylmuramate: L-alanyl-gamma-D-glutamyl-meso-diaminopimelate ligase